MNRVILSKQVNKEVNGFSYKSNSTQKHDDHPPFLQNINWKEKFLNKIVIGDNYTLLQEIPNNSIHLVITSPLLRQSQQF